jgi:hypothetical protein
VKEVISAVGEDRLTGRRQRTRLQRIVVRIKILKFIEAGETLGRRGH